MSAKSVLDDLDLTGSQPVIKEKSSEPSYHELSTVFTSFEDTVEFQGLVSSLKQYGLFEPILMWQGYIVDGRHRHMGCLEAGIKPEYEVLPDDMPFIVVRDRVIAANLMRRHLTTGQRAMTAAALANMTSGARTDLGPTANSPEVKSNKEAAEQLKVSERTVREAKALKRDAPDLAEEVSKGNMTLNAASEENRERQGKPKKKEKTNAPKPKLLDLDEMMRIGGDNWNGYVASGALVSTARDLHLQEGEKGMIRSIMHFIESGEGKHSQSYNAAGLVALYKGLGEHIDELEVLSQYKSTETQTKQ